jgi:hypothetical protein
MNLTKNRCYYIGPTKEDHRMLQSQEIDGKSESLERLEYQIRDKKYATRYGIIQRIFNTTGVREQIWILKIKIRLIGLLYLGRQYMIVAATKDNSDANIISDTGDESYHAMTKGSRGRHLSKIRHG